MTGRVSAEQNMVKLRDGIRLATETWLSAGGDPLPTLLVRTPYGIASARASHDPVSLVKAGWAVVLQDVRGRNESEGEFDPFHQEILDGRDTVDWCSAQPWSDGRVVMSGSSYLGAAQWLAASSAPPALKAIAPAVISPTFREAFLYDHGAFRHALANQWALNIAATKPRATKTHLQRAGRLQGKIAGLLRKPSAATGVGTVFPQYDRWLDYEDDSYWQPIDVSRRFRNLDVAGYHLGGWYDPFCEGNIAGYVGMRRSAASAYARASQRLVIGPWWHVGVYQPNTVYEEFGLSAVGFPWEPIQFLRAAADRQEVPTGASVFLMGANRWLHLPDWPPPAYDRYFYLAADGGLAESPSVASGVDRYTHDPADPVPNLGGRTLGGPAPLLIGPMDQRPVEERPDVLVYTTGRLQSDLSVVGMVRAKVWFATTAETADVVVKLVDVHPDGKALNVVDGVRRIRRQSPRPRVVDVEVGSTAMVFRRGHRLRVEIASANSPLLDCSPRGEQAVHHGGRTPSQVILPEFA